MKNIMPILVIGFSVGILTGCGDDNNPSSPGSGSRLVIEPNLAMSQVANLGACTEDQKDNLVPGAYKRPALAEGYCSNTQTDPAVRSEQDTVASFEALRDKAIAEDRTGCKWTNDANKLWFCAPEK